jgi:type II secretory pathway pseudopilin PulG
MKLIYAIAALVVLLAFLETADTVVENKKEMEAIGAFKAYIDTARAAGITGNQPPDIRVSLPEGYRIAVAGDFVELLGEEGVIIRERWTSTTPP